MVGMMEMLDGAGQGSAVEHQLLPFRIARHMTLQEEGRRFSFVCGKRSCFFEIGESVSKFRCVEILTKA